MDEREVWSLLGCSGFPAPRARIPHRRALRGSRDNIPCGLPIPLSFLGAITALGVRAVPGSGNQSFSLKRPEGSSTPGIPMSGHCTSLFYPAFDLLCFRKGNFFFPVGTWKPLSAKLGPRFNQCNAIILNS